MITFQSMVYSQSIDGQSTQNTESTEDSLSSERFIIVIDNYLNEKLGVEYGGKLSLNDVQKQSEVNFVIGEFKDNTLYSGGKSTFNAQLSQQGNDIIVTEFCYNKYDEYNGGQNLKCLENTGAIQELQQ